LSQIRKALLAVVMVAVAFCFGLWLYMNKQQEVVRSRARQAAAQLTSLTRELSVLRKDVARLHKLNEEQGLLLQRQVMRSISSGRVTAEANEAGPGAGAQQQRVAQSIIQWASTEYKAGRYYNAREQARQALEILTHNDEAYRLLGLAACMLKDTKEAQRAVDNLRSSRRKQVWRVCEENGVRLITPRGPQPNPTQRELNAAFAIIEPDIKRCARQHGATGLVQVRFILGRDGKVREAEVTGKLARTAVGKCMAAAAREARVKPFTGPPLTVTYPFVLSTVPGHALAL